MALDASGFRDGLLARREELAAEERVTAADRSPVTLDQESVGRLSRVDALQVQAMALAQQRRREIERMAIESALRRIEDGEFGYCVRCGEEIGLTRLQHNAAVTLCIDCARQG